MEPILAGRTLRRMIPSQQKAFPSKHFLHMHGGGDSEAVDVVFSLNKNGCLEGCMMASSV